MMRFGWLYCEARKRRDESRRPAGFEPGSSNARFSLENDGALFISCRPGFRFRRYNDAMLIPIYTGIFLDNAEVYGLFPPQLSVQPSHLHVTLSYRGGAESAHEELLGKVVKVRIVAYGNNNKNEGLKVELLAENPELQKLCDAVKVPHISLSASREAKMVNTRFLEFTPLEKPVELTGRYGVVTRSGLLI